MSQSRRDFLKLSTTTAAALGIGLVACNRKDKFKLEEINDSERIKIGLIGVGTRGRSILKALELVPEIKVIALCDTLDFQLEKGLKHLHNKYTRYTDYNQLLKHQGLEAVIIATPLHEHYPMVMAALEADVHILCEKALALNIEQCQKIKIKGDKSNKLFQVSYQYQLNPIFNAIKNIIDKGHLGSITRIEATWDRNGSWRRKVPSPELEQQINWRLYKAYSGGLMAELASHELNMIDNLLGAHPTKVVGTGGIDYWKDGREIYDNVHALFDYPNGVKVGFHSGTTNNHEDYQIKFYGTKGTIVTYGMKKAEIYPQGEKVEEKWKDSIDSITGASIKIIGKDNKRIINPLPQDEIIFPTDNDYFNVTWRLYKNFAAAIKGSEKLLLGLDDGYQSAISVHMANDAIRNEKVSRWLPEYDV